MKPAFHIALALCCVLSLSSSASAQQGSSVATAPTLQQELQRLGVAAIGFYHSLPSFTCQESVVSQQVRGHKVRRTVQASGTVRVIRDPDGSLNETYTYKRSFHLLFIPTNFPVYISGGFGSALSYFLPAARGCYRYSLSPGRIDFESSTHPASGHICREPGLKGFALLNAADNVTHIERTIPPDVAKPLKLATFASVDLAPVDLNGHLYQLSHHVVGDIPLSNAIGHFEATYTNCHLFTATVTIGPATEVPSTGTTKPQ